MGSLVNDGPKTRKAAMKTAPKPLSLDRDGSHILQCRALQGPGKPTLTQIIDAAGAQ
jgi:hypothetical protein